jgi:hypothetical protein
MAYFLEDLLVYVGLFARHEYMCDATVCLPLLVSKEQPVVLVDGFSRAPTYANPEVLVDTRCSF